MLHNVRRLIERIIDHILVPAAKFNIIAHDCGIGYMDEKPAAAVTKYYFFN
jgi:hypothetical protein